MYSLVVHRRFKLAGFVVLIACLVALSRLGGTQNTTYSHGTTTCLGEKEVRGIRLILTQTNLCGANLYPRLEIELRQLPLRVQKSIVIGPNNWAFRCSMSHEPCEQIPSGVIVFDHLEKGSIIESHTVGRYEFKLRGGAAVVERGNFKVDCVLPCGNH
jgi:hypothetical protein